MELLPPPGPTDRMRGSRDAPATLVEFGDYQCPYCAEARGVVEALLVRSRGSLRYIFRNYPLVDLHPNAMAAALVAEAADETRFWSLHDMIFSAQESLDDVTLIELAEQAGLSRLQAQRALKGSSMAKVRADMASGDGSGIQGTPSFFVNGFAYEGEPTVEALDRALLHASSLSAGTAPHPATT